MPRNYISLNKAQEIVKDENHPTDGRINVDLHFNYKKSLINEINRLLSVLITISTFTPSMYVAQSSSTSDAESVTQLIMLESIYFDANADSVRETVVEALNVHDVMPLFEFLSDTLRRYELSSSTQAIEDYKLLVFQYVAHKFSDRPMEQQAKANEFIEHRVSSLSKLAFYYKMLSKFRDTLTHEFYPNILQENNEQEEDTQQNHFQM